METLTPSSKTWQVETSLPSCWVISVRGLVYLSGESYLQRCCPAQPLQAQLQAAMPALANVFQQGQNPPQQPLPNVNTNSLPPVPPSSVPQQSTVAAALAPNNLGASQSQPKNVNQSVNGGSGPGLPTPQNIQGPTNGVNNTTIPTSAPGKVQATATPTLCRLAGCTKPVYTDATSNNASEYCSKRHRE